MKRNVRAFELTGTGTVTFGIRGNNSAIDASSTGSGVGSSKSVTMGTAPTPAMSYAHTGAVRVTNLAFKVSASSGAWSLDRLTARLRS